MIHLYAEHLLYIQTLSVQASLPSVSNKETKATISVDGTSFTLTHEGETANIKLPVNVPSNSQSNIALKIPAIPSQEVSFRIQLQRQPVITNGTATNGTLSDSDNVVPWTANSLTKETEISCGHCHAVIVPGGTIQEWKALPSEGWAEMMEFWHCHKPDEPHDLNHKHLKKGYAASSQLAIESGVGMVDVMNILLSPQDCHNISVQPNEPAHNEPVLRCSNCSAFVGFTEPSSPGYYLRKPSLSVTSRADRVRTSFKREKWFSALLLEAMETQGVRKFIIHELHTPTPGLLKIWLFTPDLTISSSARSSRDPARVTKILWQEHSPIQSEMDQLTASALSLGDIKLRHGELVFLRSALKKSGALLASSARRFQEWDVGLLERFPADVGIE